jgi:hypothetical protein
LLIYERAVPVSPQRHGDVSVKAGRSLAFAKNVNSVPLMVAEFANAGAEYAVVFAGQGDGVVPVVLLGVRDDENLFVGADGSWQGRYVPAFLRRSPFVFATGDDGANFTLCVDEDYDGVNRDGRGERLFDNDGERTQYLQGVLGFLQAYQVQFQRTLAFTKRLVDLKLLEPMQARFTLRNGSSMTLGGFQAVSRERLKALTGDQLAALSANDELEMIYIHLQSLAHLTATAERMGAGAQVPGAGRAADETAPENVPA